MHLLEIWHSVSLSGKFVLMAKVVTSTREIGAVGRQGSFLRTVSHIFMVWHLLALFSIPFHCPPSTHFNSTHSEQLTRFFTNSEFGLSILPFHPSMPLCSSSHPLSSRSQVQNFAEHNCHCLLSLISVVPWTDSVLFAF